MEVFKLNPTTFYPIDHITGFKSLIWTERYLNPGDFQILVEDDISILSVLPTGSMLSHTGTGEVMIVESHEITRSKEKKLLVKVSGRSFETFLENRLTFVSDYPILDGSGASIESVEVGTPENLALSMIQKRLHPTLAPNVVDRVANLSVRQEIVSMDTSRTVSTPRTDVYSYVTRLLQVASAGLKTVRPSGAQTTLDIVIHDGVDRSGSVVFYAQSEDLIDAQYFWSIKNYKTHITIATNTTNVTTRHRDIPSELSGLDRRVFYVDAGDIQDVATLIPALQSRVQIELDQRRKLQLMQATVSPTARPRFKVHYDVGDVVTVFGEFATSGGVRVTEHILSLDETGIKGYPTLSSI